MPVRATTTHPFLPPGYPGRDGRGPTWILKAISGATALYFRGFHGLRVVNVPDIAGPYVLAPNHSSYLDPIVLQLLFPRHITYLMDQDIYNLAGLRWFYRLWGAIPVSAARTTPSAIKEALTAIRGGAVVGIFPEGRISLDGRLQEGMAGVSMLMMKARVPVVPVAIDGAFRVLPKWARCPRPGRITITFGDPIAPPGNGEDKKAAEAKFRDRVMSGIAELRPNER